MQIVLELLLISLYAAGHDMLRGPYKIIIKIGRDQTTKILKKSFEESFSFVFYRIQ